MHSHKTTELTVRPPGGSSCVLTHLWHNESCREETGLIFLIIKVILLVFLELILNIQCIPLFAIVDQTCWAWSLSALYQTEVLPKWITTVTISASLYMNREHEWFHSLWLVPSQPTKNKTYLLAYQTAKIKCGSMDPFKCPATTALDSESYYVGTMLSSIWEKYSTMCKVNALHSLRDGGERQLTRHNSLLCMPKEAPFTHKHTHSYTQTRTYTHTQHRQTE